MLIVLKTFLSNRQVIVLSYSNNNIKTYYYDLQPKLLNYYNYYNNNNNNNNNNYSNVKINISEYLGENNSSSIEVEPNNTNDNSIIPYNDDISLLDTFNNLKRANDYTGREEWFIFLYNGRKEICAVPVKIIDKDNPEVVGKYKYFLVTC
jgi:hypothetical protein